MCSAARQVVFSLCWFASVCKTFWSDVVPFDYFSFCFPCLKEHIPKKLLLRAMSESSLPVCSPRSFMVSGLTLKSFWVLSLFCMWCEKGVEFHCFRCICPVSSASFMEETAMGLVRPIN